MTPQIYLLIFLAFLIQSSINFELESSNKTSTHLVFLEHLNTITKMHGPQCRTMDYHSRNKSTFHVISCYSFLPERFKWRSTILKYAFDESVKENAKPPLVNALREWRKVTPFRFYRVKNMTRAHIRISFKRGNHGDGHAFGEPEGGISHAFGPGDGRVHFDVEQNWASNGDKSAFDIQFVALHEFGHVLGLGHSENKEAAMYPVVCLGERKHLHQDDINGIKALYNF